MKYLHLIQIRALWKSVFSCCTLLVLFSRTVIDIHFFLDSIIDILFFDSDNFDLILKNCTDIIFFFKILISVV